MYNRMRDLLTRDYSKFKTVQEKIAEAKEYRDFFVSRVSKSLSKTGYFSTLPFMLEDFVLHHPNFAPGKDDVIKTLIAITDAVAKSDEPNSLLKATVLSRIIFAFVNPPNPDEDLSPKQTKRLNRLIFENWKSKEMDLCQQEPEMARCDLNLIINSPGCYPANVSATAKELLKEYNLEPTRTVGVSPPKDTAAFDHYRYT